jgi:hypothetical protein
LSRAVRDAASKSFIQVKGGMKCSVVTFTFADMLQHNTAGEDPVEVARLLKELADANIVSRGILLPEGQSVAL